MNTQTNALRALIIEDVESDVLLLLHELNEAGYQTTYAHVDTPAQLLHELQQKEWDIVFCDYSMPKMDGGQALDIVRAANSRIPFIFISGTMKEGVALQSMYKGAQDYIMKNDLKKLAPIVHRELNRAG